jgi:hypothetical protein
MKKILLLLVIIFLSFYSASAQFIKVKSVEVIPSFPTEEDTINIRTVFSTYDSRVNRLYDSITVKGSEIDISMCVTPPISFPRSPYTDTFTVGKLPLGNYIVRVRVYMSSSHNDCVPEVGDTSELIFTVTYPNSIKKKEKSFNSSVSLYPNPSPGIQTLSIISEKPLNLDVSIYDVTGRMLKEIYSGKIGQGEEAFTANLQDLTPGVYLYKIVLGEEIIYSKVIKN